MLLCNSMYLQKKDKDLFFWPQDKSNSYKNKISSSTCLWDLFQPELTPHAHPWPLIGVDCLHVLPPLFIFAVPLWLFFPLGLVVSQCNIQELCFSHSWCLCSDWPCFAVYHDMCLHFVWGLSLFTEELSCSSPANSTEGQWLQPALTTFHPYTSTSGLYQNYSHNSCHHKKASLKRRGINLECFKIVY